MCVDFQLSGAALSRWRLPGRGRLRVVNLNCNVCADAPVPLPAASRRGDRTLSLDDPRGPPGSTAGAAHLTYAGGNVAFRPSFFKNWAPSRGCVGGAEWEASTMSRAKQISKRKNRTKAVTVLGVAGALSLTGGTSGAAVGPTGDMPTENAAPVISLGDEEISDVSLATFYVFDNENPAAHRPGLQLAKKRSHGGSRGCAVNRGCGGCAVACGGCGGGGGPTGSGGPDGM
jgi:hypothetical protein